MFEGDRQLEAGAWFLGERIDVRALDRGPFLARAPTVVRAGGRGAAVVFRYGAVVLFGCDAAESHGFLASLAPLVSDPFGEPEHDEAEIVIDPEAQEGVDARGRVVLREASLERLQIVAEVLAKSAVLAHYEESVAEVLDRIEPLAQTLRGEGRRGVGSRELLREIGEALLTETRTVGRVEVIEKPESAWDDPELDRLYTRLAEEYELRERDLALTRKLELASRTASISLELVQNRRSLRVEWYIVILILVEIVLILYELFAGRGS